MEVARLLVPSLSSESSLCPREPDGMRSTGDSILTSASSSSARFANSRAGLLVGGSGLDGGRIPMSICRLRHGEGGSARERSAGVGDVARMTGDELRCPIPISNNNAVVPGVRRSGEKNGGASIIPLKERCALPNMRCVPPDGRAGVVGMRAGVRGTRVANSWSGEKSGDEVGEDGRLTVRRWARGVDGGASIVEGPGPSAGSVDVGGMLSSELSFLRGWEVSSAESLSLRFFPTMVTSGERFSFSPGTSASRRVPLESSSRAGSADSSTAGGSRDADRDDDERSGGGSNAGGRLGGTRVGGAEVSDLANLGAAPFVLPGWRSIDFARAIGADDCGTSEVGIGERRVSAGNSWGNAVRKFRATPTSTVVPRLPSASRAAVVKNWPT